MMKVVFVTAAIGMAAAAFWQTPQAPQPAGLQVGDQAPDFTLPASDGKTYRLSDLKGKAVVIAWFPKAFTGG